MRKKLPKEASILSQPYKIVYLDNLEDVNPDHDEDCLGHVNFNEKVIRIYRGNRPIESIYSTIFHEVLHALFYSFDMSDNVLSDTQEEKVVDLLSTGITDFLVRNPWCKYLTRKEIKDHDRNKKE